MANLKKILNIINDTDKLDNTLNELTIYQTYLILKELYDQYTYVHTHKVTIEEAIADSERDQVANRFGREMGRKFPNCDCSILLHDLLPDYKK